MNTYQSFVIVGAGLTGAKAAQTLREEAFAGRVILLGGETEQPYERPPLSKGYLLGKEDRTKIFVHPEDWYPANSVELRRGMRVTSLDRHAHQVQLEDGERIGYTKLLLATGASPRTLDLPGAELDGIFSLRRVADAEHLQQALHDGGRITIIGAGWIGLETAAAARAYGCEVTIVEPQPTPLRAALGPQMGEFFADLHRHNGVDLRLRTAVSGFRGHNGRVVAVGTGNGDEIPADTVIVGVGARPNTELADQARLTVDNGVVVDQSLRTADPDVYAAGDLANALHPHYGRHIRVEHWANALHTGPAVAKAMLGQQISNDRIPYFFTDQYDIGMEFTGWFPPGGYDTVLTRGDLPGKAFQAFWLTSDDRIVAGMHVNLWDQGVGPIEELIRSGKPVHRTLLTDPTVPLAEVTRA